MRRSWIVLALSLCTLVPATVTAQRGQGRPEIDRAQLEERVRAQMGRLMRERLGLDEAEAERLSEVVRGFDGRRRTLFAEEQATRRSVETILRDGANDEDEARELIARMWELRQEEAALFREEQEALLDVLTPVQVLRLQELRQDLGQRIRALGQGRGGRPGVAPGAGPSRGPGPGSRGRQGAVRAPGTDAQPLL
jgi:Spy/CpxP family protein refolding chaperone